MFEDVGRIGANAAGPTQKFSWHLAATGEDGPGPRSRHGLVHDELTHTTILFGGIVWRDGGRLLSDTWELRHGLWSKADVPISPPARHRGAMVYDPVRGCSVLFGGQNRWGKLLND